MAAASRRVSQQASASDLASVASVQFNALGGAAAVDRVAQLQFSARAFPAVAEVGGGVRLAAEEEKGVALRMERVGGAEDHFSVYKVAGAARRKIQLKEDIQAALDQIYLPLKLRLLQPYPAGSTLKLDLKHSKAEVTKPDGSSEQILLNEEDHPEVERLRQKLVDFRLESCFARWQKYQKDSLALPGGKEVLKREGAVLISQVKTLLEFRQAHLAKSLEGKTAEQKREILNRFTMGEVALHSFHKTITDQMAKYTAIINGLASAQEKKHAQRVLDELNRVKNQLERGVDGFALGFALTHPVAENDPEKRFAPAVIEGLRKEIRDELIAQDIEQDRQERVRWYNKLWTTPEAREAQQISFYAHEAARLTLVSSRSDNDRFAAVTRGEAGGESLELLLKVVAEDLISGQDIVFRSGSLLNRLPKEVAKEISDQMTVALRDAQLYEKVVKEEDAVKDLQDMTPAADCIAAYKAAETTVQGRVRRCKDLFERNI